MAEKITKGDTKSGKGGTGYSARRWREWWVFDCDAKGCGVNADSRESIERHVLAVHGVVQAGDDGGKE